MRRLITLAVALLALSACGEDAGGIVLPSDPEAPVIQIRSEGGFAPIEQMYSSGPTYTLLGGGRLIYEGPVIMIYPGPLLPNTQVTEVTDEQMSEILAMVEEIGLPDMMSEHDDSVADDVADATTEVITFWDDDGEHVYSVYALGIDTDPVPATAAAVELVDVLSAAASTGVSDEYTGDRVRIIAGVSQTAPEPGFEDIRPWPLAGEDPARWEQLDLGFSCKVFGPETIEPFGDATQVTQWLHPDPMMDAPPFTLMVRYLHPGEPDCPVGG
jgi:hypothetical protein